MGVRGQSRGHWARTGLGRAAWGWGAHLEEVALEEGAVVQGPILPACQALLQPPRAGAQCSVGLPLQGGLEPVGGHISGRAEQGGWDPSRPHSAAGVIPSLGDGSKMTAGLEVVEVQDGAGPKLARPPPPHVTPRLATIPGCPARRVLPLT